VQPAGGRERAEGENQDCRRRRRGAEPLDHRADQRGKHGRTEQRARDPKGLVPYRPEFLSGFQAEAYQLTLQDGFPIAKRSIDERLRALIRRDIGGDQQRIHSVSTRYSQVTFKHVLLPVWISAYRYGDKVYRFAVNGQTGEISGESPKSWWKVALLIAGIVAVVAALVLATGKS